MVPGAESGIAIKHLILFLFFCANLGGANCNANAIATGAVTRTHAHYRKHHRGGEKFEPLGQMHAAIEPAGR
jgi:hypothetical protein